MRDSKSTDIEKTTVESVSKSESKERTEEKDFAEENHSNCKIEDIESFGDNRFLCSYEGVKHDFILELPQQIKQAPLVVMLHGYGESAEAFQAKVVFEQEANSIGCAVVYVTGAPSPEDATSANGWNSGMGDNSNDDVGFLCGLVHELCERYDLDSERVYAVGFSNGAFMTHRLATEAGDVFKAVVSVAGMMPEKIWENKPEHCNVGIFQITGEKDDVVPKNSDGSAKYAKAPAIEDVLDYYIKINELSLTDTSAVGKKSVLKKYGNQNSDMQVWDLFIPDGRHSWPDSQITGVNINQLILEFFSLEKDNN